MAYSSLPDVIATTAWEGFLEWCYVTGLLLWDVGTTYAATTASFAWDALCTSIYWLFWVLLIAPVNAIYFHGPEALGMWGSHPKHVICARLAPHIDPFQFYAIDPKGTLHVSQACNTMLERHLWSILTIIGVLLELFFVLHWCSQTWWFWRSYLPFVNSLERRLTKRLDSEGRCANEFYVTMPVHHYPYPRAFVNFFQAAWRWFRNPVHARQGTVEAARRVYDTLVYGAYRYNPTAYAQYKKQQQNAAKWRESRDYFNVWQEEDNAVDDADFPVF